MILTETGESPGEKFTILKTYMIFKGKLAGEPLHQGTEPQLIIWLRDHGLSHEQAQAIVSETDENGSSEVLIPQ